MEKRRLPRPECIRLVSYAHCILLLHLAHTCPKESQFSTKKRGAMAAAVDLIFFWYNMAVVGSRPKD
jgi:hypothetical protein